jgi:hypothetical protein
MRREQHDAESLLESDHHLPVDTAVLRGTASTPRTAIYTVVRGLACALTGAVYISAGWEVVRIPGGRVSKQGRCDPCQDPTRDATARGRRVHRQSERCCTICGRRRSCTRDQTATLSRRPRRITIAYHRRRPRILDDRQPDRTPSTTAAVLEEPCDAWRTSSLSSTPDNRPSDISTRERKLVQRPPRIGSLSARNEQHTVDECIHG